MLQTCLNAAHRALGAVMVDFAGWDMPIRYTGIVEEHAAVRRAAGLFDLGHMARIDITGPEREAFLDSLVTNKVAGLPLGQAHYALLCREDGGILDDVIYYQLQGRILLVANASNREKVLAWLAKHQGSWKVSVVDRTLEVAMIAIQGPLSPALTERTIGCKEQVKNLSYYAAAEVEIDGQPAVLARTGYTGEDGFEIYVPPRVALGLWSRFLEAGKAEGVLPIGLGARDTLRLEACMPLYGHEITEETNPLEAGLGFAVKLDKPFIGRDALAKVKAEGPSRRLVAFEVQSKRVARQDFEILEGETVVGRVTSGTFSPTRERNLGMAYVPDRLAKVGTSLAVSIRGKPEPITIVKKPFYKRS